MVLYRVIKQYKTEIMERVNMCIHTRTWSHTNTEKGMKGKARGSIGWVDVGK